MRDQAVASAISSYQDEVAQLRATAATLRDALDHEAVSREQMINSALAQDRSEIAQLQQTIQELRDRLQDRMSTPG